MKVQPFTLNRSRASAFLLSYAGGAWLLIQVVDVISPKVGMPTWVPTATITVATLALPFILLAYVIALPKLSPAHIDKQIEQVKGAKEYAFLSVHTLDPSSRDARILSLQKALGEAATRGVNVRLIAPGGVDRVQAAYELAVIHGVSIRVLDELDDQDLRFTLVDGGSVLLSHQPLREKALSKTFCLIDSERLHSILHSYFNQLWVNSRAMNFDQYLKSVCLGLCGTLTRVSPQRLSDRLGIPVHVIHATLKKLPIASNPNLMQEFEHPKTTAAIGPATSSFVGEA